MFDDEEIVEQVSESSEEQPAVEKIVVLEESDADNGL